MAIFDATLHANFTLRPNAGPALRGNPKGQNDLMAKLLEEKLSYQTFCEL
jgi:hypothetical protein